MSLVKYNFLLAIIFFMNVSFSGNTDTLTIENFEKLKLKLGLDRQIEFDEDAFNLLVEKLDSLNIKDEQLIDGYEWGGGQAGFKSYLDKNIDVLLSYFNSEISEIDSLGKEIIPDSIIINEKVLVEQDIIKPVQDLLVKVSKSDVKEVDKIKKSKKGIFSGLRIGSGLGKALIKGTSLSNYSSYFENAFSIRTPIGINIGPFMTRVGYESAGYSFESFDGLSESYFGSGAGVVLNIDLSKIIKIGGQNIIKEFIIGKLAYEHGSGFTAGYNLNLLMGKLPFSISVSSRFNTINFTNGSGSSYYGSLSAGLGLDLK
tara:strand:- start:821 stop:1765 length:945 start_codon:yes stop_codon:yes gene_type:complete